jgi:methanogenic corrinoid protein MtbC1
LAKILLACVEGNQHSLGLQMTAEAFRIEGWDVRLLGANVPTEAMVRHVRAWRPDVVAVSVSLSQQLPALTDLLSKLGNATGDAGPHLLVGGLALASPESRKAVHLADGWAGDCMQALRVATSLCEGDALVGRELSTSVEVQRPNTAT